MRLSENLIALLNLNNILLELLPLLLAVFGGCEILRTPEIMPEYELYIGY
jgi:hypothetical protein